MIEALARLALAFGMEAGCTRRLIVSAPREATPLAEAIRAIAPFAEVIYSDPDHLYTALLAGDETALFELEASILSMAEAMTEGAARLNILAPRPDLLSGVDPAHLARVHERMGASHARAAALLAGHDGVDLALPYPSDAWAEVAFPQRSIVDARARLSAALSDALRLDARDPAKAWRARLADLDERAAALSALGLSKLRLTGKDTTLSVALDVGAVWERATGSICALPNEALTVPLLLGTAQGHLGRLRPMALSGERVEGLTLAFDQAEVPTSRATRGEAAVRDLVGLNHAPCRVSALRLVLGNSAARRTGVDFLNPLIDGAAAHTVVLAAGPYQGGAAELRVEAFLDDPTVHIEGIDAAGRLHPIE